jgi:ACS family hexuronate transporter-like MFS transporter
MSNDDQNPFRAPDAGQEVFTNVNAEAGFRSRAWPWSVCGILALATLLNYMDRQALSVTMPTLKQNFQLTEDRIGRVEAAFGYAFAAGSLLFGFLADRWGPKWLYPVVLAGWSLAGVATSFAASPVIPTWLESSGDPAGTGVYRWLLVCRIALGLCEAGHWPCALLTVRAILSSEQRTLGNGVLQSGASIGAIIVPLYIEFADRAGQHWTFAFWSVGLAGLAWIPAWFALVAGADLRGTVGRAAVTEDAPAKQSETGLFRRLLTAGIVVATLTVSWQFLRAWLVLFLQDHHQYTPQAARGLMSGYFLASDAGCLMSGVLVARLTRSGRSVDQSRLITFATFCALTACGAVVPFAGNGWLMIVLLLVTGAGILGLHPVYYSITQDLSARHMGALSGLLAAGGWVVSSTFQMLIGDEIKAAKSYDTGLMIVGLAPMIGLIALAVIWPKSRAEP